MPNAEALVDLAEFLRISVGMLLVAKKNGRRLPPRRSATSRFSNDSATSKSSTGETAKAIGASTPSSRAAITTKSAAADDPPDHAN